MQTKERKPEIVVFAGPNGSGKSTITGEEWIKGPYINADDIQREQGITNIEAANIADKMRYDFIAAGETFSFETVLSTERKLNMLRDAKEKGYFIRGYFIMTCDPELNVQRVHARVESGGHSVDDDTVRHGTGNPSIRTLKRLAAGLGMTLKLEFVPTPSAGQ